MCNCMDEMLQMATERVKPNLPEHNPATLKFEWQNKMIRLDGSKNTVMLPISIQYRRTKAGGSEYKNTTKDTINMAMTYCPFCGVEIEKEGDKA